MEGKEGEGRDSQGGPKSGPQTHDHNSVKSEPILKILFAGRFLGEFVAKCIFNIPQHLAYVATLSCETCYCQQNMPLMINYKVV